ncbi:hypothetical protein DMN91_003697 [Ooceraea biroi]|uniref:Peptidase A2 domain-containing protein n=1 Tax=Ooceraea biroi TaxID=2015173 RepID=A0A3L8DT70_OOCBI|nr:hypothetical protein DMN91_003697 [Ooceraea biroi]
MPPSVGAMNGGQPQDKLLITDKNSGITFLIDTGSDVSLLPRSHQVYGTKPTPYQLFAANGTLIDTYGEKVLTLNLGLRRAFKWSFCVAGVTRPIIGADLLKQYGLLVDLRGKRLIDSTTNCCTSGTLHKSSQISILSVNPNSEYHQLLKSFPDLIRKPQSYTSRTHGIHHHIITKGPLVASWPRRLPAEKLKLAKEAFRNLVEAGIFRPSSSPWAAPLHLAPKKEGT